jgi:hypothetical protein
MLEVACASQDYGVIRVLRGVLFYGVLGAVVVLSYSDGRV